MMYHQSLLLILIRHPFGMYPSESTHFHRRGLKNASIKGVDDKREITATFVTTAKDSFLPLRLIYQGKSKRCLPKFTFPSDFHVRFTPNHWSNLEKCEDLFNVIFFTYLSAEKKELCYPQEQRSLILKAKALMK